MSIRRRIKVLIVDDSLLFRETLARAMAADPDLEIVGTAADPYAARDKIIAFEPDVMTLDVEMPRMNGIEFLRRLMPQYPLPVVVVSSISANIFDALHAGAVDFVTKTEPGTSKGMEDLIHEIRTKLKVAATANLVERNSQSSPRFVSSSLHTQTTTQVIAIGASTGGTEAIYHVLRAFSRDMPGILIVQHMPAGFTRMFAERLNKQTQLEVKEAENGDKLYSGRVLIAAGDYHMRLNKARGGLVIECLRGHKVSGHCPSIDVLFESTAEAVGRNAIGVLLTGMGSDGAQGLLAMRSKGARTLGQDERSSIVYGMPKAAYVLGAVEKQVSLDNMAQSIYSIVSGR